MSEYTPITDVVRSDYMHSNTLHRAGFNNTHETYSDEFDRWLEQHDAEVAKATEERIIKLLQAQRVLCSDKECCWLATEYKCHCEEVIALIKGSTNA